MTEPYNPYQTPSTPANPVGVRITVSSRVLTSLAVAIILQVLTIVIGLVASFIHIESIIPTGLVLSLSGLLVLELSRRTRILSGLLLGLSGPLISLGCFLLIFSLGWSPSDAAAPIPRIGSGYALFACPLAYIAFRSVASQRISSLLSARPESAATPQKV